MVMEHWELIQRQRGNITANALRQKFGDVPFLSVATPEFETEKPQEFRPFTDQEKESLVKDGAVILSLTGETIEGQQTAGRLFRYITDGGDRLLKLPSLKADVAIYPEPKRFFISNSGNKNLPTQEKLAEKDGEELRKRTGLEDLDVIIPDQASTFTELIFKYLDETGVWLFGPDYGYLYGRTKNPVNESGSLAAGVGDSGPDGGVHIAYWDRDLDYGLVLVVRLVVAKKK